MDKQKNSFLGVVKRFLEVNQKHIPAFIGVIFMLLISNILGILLNYYIGGLIDNITNWNQTRFRNFVIIVLIVQVLNLVFSYLSYYTANKVSEISVKNIRIHTYDCLMNAHMKWMDENKVGDIVSRINNDLESLVSVVSNFLTWQVSNIFMFLIGVITCCILNWKLTLVSIASLPILIGLQIFIGKPIAKYSGIRWAAEGKANANLMDLINGHTVAKLYDKKFLTSKFEENVDESTEAGKKSTALELGLYPIQSLISFIPYITMYAMSVHLIVNGEFTVGGMVAFTLTFLCVSSPIYSLSGQVRFIMNAIGLSSRIFALWNIESEVAEGVSQPKEDNQVIRFEDVKFSYSDNTEEEHDILDEMSLNLEKGKLVAIVGNSGEGKSTILKLILGIYKNYSGKIMVMGNEVKEWNVNSLREHISYVGQNSFLIHDSIYENIKLGNVNATDEEIYEIVKMFGLDDLNLKEKIGEHGVKLSGGQKQRICLARAFLKKADLIILDEPTSALDTESEYYVTRAISEYLKGKTGIIIAHRLSTVRNADVIMCLQNGKIIESGSFDELMSRDSIIRTKFMNQIGGGSCDG